jgi:hypothetical protein
MEVDRDGRAPAGLQLGTGQRRREQPRRRQRRYDGRRRGRRVRLHGRRKALRFERRLLRRRAGQKPLHRLRERARLHRRLLEELGLHDRLLRPHELARGQGVRDLALSRRARDGVQLRRGVLVGGLLRILLDPLLLGRGLRGRTRLGRLVERVRQPELVRGQRAGLEHLLSRLLGRLGVHALQQRHVHGESRRQRRRRGNLQHLRARMLGQDVRPRRVWGLMRLLPFGGVVQQLRDVHWFFFDRLVDRQCDVLHPGGESNVFVREYRDGQGNVQRDRLDVRTLHMPA